MKPPKTDSPAANGTPETFHDLAINEVLDILNTPQQSGLTEIEARRRLEVYGPNHLREAPPTTIWQMLWDQFNNFIVWLLIAAAAISAVVGDWAEAIAIMLIVLLNAILGVVQERRAERALAALRKLAAPDALVVRESRRLTVPADLLVPGDIVILEAGNFIPADVRLLEAVNLRVDEAALTGESVPVQKDATQRHKKDIPLGDRKNTAFMGTMVNYGRGSGIVVSTGMRTQIGLIAEMLQAVVQEPTPLQKRLDSLGHTLGYAALALCSIVFVLGWIREGHPLEMFIVAISLAIAAVPEGLPAVVTIALALGMREMIQRNALIRRLSSVETLGSATVIGSDKTGTLTQNKMTVTRMWVDNQAFDITGTGYELNGEFQVDGQAVNLADYPAALTALWAGALNNDAVLETAQETGDVPRVRIVGDPTEGALLVAAAKVGGLKDSLLDSFPRVQEIPFDSARKRMVTFHELAQPSESDISPFNERFSGQKAIVIKGAPDVVLALCTHYQKMDDQPAPLDDPMRTAILDANEAMTAKALRVLAVAYRTAPNLPETLEPEIVEQDLIFAGLIGMIDPPRDEVALALQKARRAGIKTVMITGDYPRTAQAIAESIGLATPGQRVITGAELNEMSDEELRRVILREASVFARVSPEHKVRIVQALRDNGEVVAMTGDGINDAPALKRADIGVAMGITGTDVAKETADMVLTDDNYASIVAAIEQGRVIYGNIRKFVYYLLSCNLAEIFSIFLMVLIGKPHPLEAIQLLWLNLVTDGAPALALGVEKGDPDVMDIPPRPSHEPIINKPMRTGIFTQTIFLTAVTLTAYLVGLNQYPEDITIARTMAFLALALAELPLAFVVRSERYPLLKIGPFTNKLMNIATSISFLLLLMVVYVPFFQPIFKTYPLGWEHWMVLLPLIAIPAIGAELVKRFTAKSWSRPQSAR